MRTEIVFDKAEKVIASIDVKVHNEYVDYWNTVVRPKTDVAAMRRWFFAFASVHTTWKGNIELYKALKAVTADDVSVEDLAEIVKRSRAGMHSVRSKAITRFMSQFWADNSTLRKPPTNGLWVPYRNQLVKDLYGLGMAKTSFGLELCWPTEAGVVCLDTHMFQLYGLDQADANQATYLAVERHWIDRCAERKLLPTICRHVFWDTLKGRSSTHYWAHVFDHSEP